MRHNARFVRGAVRDATAMPGTGSALSRGDPRIILRTVAQTLAGSSEAAETTTVLVVDDDRANLESLEKLLTREGMRVLVADSVRQALELARTHRVHVVLTDLMMPGSDGLELLEALETVSPDSEVVVMTAYGTIETAVEAMRRGAYDFLEKPLRRVHLVKTIRKAAERRSLVAENRTLREELSALRARPIVGSSPALRHALQIARQAAPSSATVLIVGESGTGKELVARLLHAESGRTGAFVPVHLAALPETIVEAELFGHEKGAFTGAHARREGRIAQAAGGTLFLDEVGDLSPAVQVKLLRVLQEGEYEPLGGRTQRASFRLVAATHRDLREMVRAGEFREDLYYRLHVITISCPPLRERRDDVPLLVDHFLDVYARKNDRTRLEVTREALDRLIAYEWPGNVRELENAVERAVVLDRDGRLGLDDLPPSVVEPAGGPAGMLSFAIGTPLDEIERRVIAATLAHTGGDKQAAARLLGISARTIYRRVGTE
ncbi:MAG: sigma-54 dependent transcriptional regulator [Myxococcota bacterium]|nr:sigma-54 dependent transcriptional regulator [Myxococcota bacterium]MDW8360812.1 sigma-54 dependent transcriptional regulator [Myxococcales bacterium]